MDLYDFAKTVFQDITRDFTGPIYEFDFVESPSDNTRHFFHYLRCSGEFGRYKFATLFSLMYNSSAYIISADAYGSPSLGSILQNINPDEDIKIYPREVIPLLIDDEFRKDVDEITNGRNTLWRCDAVYHTLCIRMITKMGEWCNEL